MIIEMHHRVSKSASEDFWKLALSMFPRLHRAKITDGIYKRIPQFQNQRKKLFAAKVPKITLKTAYQNKETEEITEVESTKDPGSQFNPHHYKKLYESAKVEVMKNLSSLRYT